MRLFQERKLPMTVFGCALALERHKPAADAIRASGFDACCHGWRWIKHFELTEAEEREHIRKAVASLQTTVPTLAPLPHAQHGEHLQGTKRSMKFPHCYC